MKPKSTTEVDRLIGRRIRTFRMAKGLTQTDLGSALGITFQQIQKYEYGTNRIGSGRLVEIAKILDVPITTLFDESKPVASSHVGPAELLSDPHSLQLIKSFANVSDRDLRRSIVMLTEAIAAHARRRRVRR